MLILKNETYDNNDNNMIVVNNIVTIYINNIVKIYVIVYVKIYVIIINIFNLYNISTICISHHIRVLLLLLSKII